MDGWRNASKNYQFDAREEAILNELRDRHFHTLSQSFSNDPHDYDLVPGRFADLYIGGGTWDTLNKDTVRSWAINNGVPEHIAEELGLTCEVVYLTLRHIRKMN